MSKNASNALGFVIALLGFIGLFMAPSYLSSYNLSLLGRFLSFGILAVGFSLIWGYTGILSLGQGVFFALGGYAMAMHLVLVQADGALPGFMARSFRPRITELPWWWQPFESAWFAFAMVLILPTLAAALLGILVFWRRISGVYFALITQALVLAFTTLIVSQQTYTNGFNGLSNFTTLLGFDLTSNSVRRGLYIATVAALLVAWLAAQWLARSHFGKLLVAIRDGENRTRFLGYNPTPYKVVVFAIAGLFAGLGGAFFVLHAGIISPADVGVKPSIEMAVWVAFGGRESITGSVLGMVLGRFLAEDISSRFPAIWPMLLGAVFILVGTVLPRGLTGLFERLAVLLTRSPSSLASSDSVQEPFVTPVTASANTPSEVSHD
ncbi:MAG: urea ABC transporter permease subunit UrtC [Deinococcota bacterium]